MTMEEIKKIKEALGMMKVHLPIGTVFTYLGENFRYFRDRGGTCWVLGREASSPRSWEEHQPVVQTPSDIIILGRRGFFDGETAMERVATGLLKVGKQLLSRKTHMAEKSLALYVAHGRPRPPCFFDDHKRRRNDVSLYFSFVMNLYVEIMLEFMRA